MNRLPLEPPPETPRQDLRETIHGVQVADPYRWLERGDAPEVRRWTRAQHARTEAWLQRVAGREALGQRLRELQYVEWTSAPQRRGERYFFARRPADKEKAIYYFRQGEEGEARLLLDPNRMEGEGNVAIQGIYPSLDGELLAYKLSRNNADTATLYLMEVSSGRLLAKDTISGARYAHPSWHPSGRGFYYTRLPEDPAIPVAQLPGHAAVYFHRIGQDPAQDRLVHDKTGDPSAFIAAHAARDGSYLVLYLQHGWAATDVHFRPLDAPEAPFQPLVKGQPALYGVTVWQGQFFVHTNEGAPRYRVFRVDPRRPGKKHWRELVAQDPERVLDDVRVIGGRLALRYLHRATTALELRTLDGQGLQPIPLPATIGTASALVGTPEHQVAFFSYSSFLQPQSIYRVQLPALPAAGAKEPAAAPVQVRQHFAQRLPLDTSALTQQQVRYPSHDGTPISMFLVHRKDLRRDGKTPFLLTGYGGFNISMTPEFSPFTIAWLELGGGLALPNLRGGGEYGEGWHRAGAGENKQNVFDDFIAAAEYLIEQGYTTPRRLAIRGGSNGGLLVGAAMTQRPELFRAVLCRVPLLDMVRYHRFGSGRTWVSEYGSAEDPEQFRTLYAYSPYHRLRPNTPYPALLMLSADSDDRVDPMHARKFTAALQHASQSGLPVLFRLETEAGHGGGDMIAKQVAAQLDELTFLRQLLGLTTPQNPQ